jgi:5-methylcytosine-specific restriction endonuclease McrA
MRPSSLKPHARRQRPEGVQRLQAGAADRLLLSRRQKPRRRNERVQGLQERWQKHYQQENAAAIQAYQTRYRADPAHRQLAKERTARYRTANPDRVREAMAAWRAMPENQRLARERTRTWRLENPRRRSEQARRRNALMKSGVATFISLELLDGKLAYWGWRCWINGPGCTVDPENWDHVKPLTKGGAHMLANLRPACGHCNRRKHDRWPFLANEFR